MVVPISLTETGMYLSVVMTVSETGISLLTMSLNHSKLTRILEPALRGNARIAIVCNISPLASCYEETQNTLQFATRAKKGVIISLGSCDVIIIVCNDSNNHNNHDG